MFSVPRSPPLTRPYSVACCGWQCPGVCVCVVLCALSVRAPFLSAVICACSPGLGSLMQIRRACKMAPRACGLHATRRAHTRVTPCTRVPCVRAVPARALERAVVPTRPVELASSWQVVPCVGAEQYQQRVCVGAVAATRPWWRVWRVLSATAQHQTTWQSRVRSAGAWALGVCGCLHVNACCC
jgi:hypothetical protein